MTLDHRCQCGHYRTNHGPHGCLMPVGEHDEPCDCSATGPQLALPIETTTDA